MLGSSFFQKKKKKEEKILSVKEGNLNSQSRWDYNLIILQLISDCIHALYTISVDFIPVARHHTNASYNKDI